MHGALVICFSLCASPEGISHYITGGAVVELCPICYFPTMICRLDSGVVISCFSEVRRFRFDRTKFLFVETGVTRSF